MNLPLNFPRSRASGALATLLLAVVPLVQAQSTDSGTPPDHQGGHHHGPPPEAIAACSGKAVGTIASFTTRNGHTVTGPCTQMHDVVAVRPPHPASGAGGGHEAHP